MNVCVLLVPYDSGRCRERMGLGPEQLLITSVEPLLRRLGHAFRTEVLTLGDCFPAEISSTFTLCRSIAERVRDCLRDGWFPLVLSGNCNAAVGTISGCGCESTGVVWFDAHGEATTPETTTSGFLDGMVISILTGQCWQNLARLIPGFVPMAGERIMLVGSRDLEPAEVALLARIGVRRFPATSPLPPWQDGTYLHFDLDVLDPSEGHWNQWAAPDGLSVASVLDAVRKIRRQAPIKAAGIASHDPEADKQGRAARAAAMVLEAAL